MRTQPLPKLNPLCEPYVRTPFSSSNRGSRVEGDGHRQAWHLPGVRQYSRTSRRSHRVMAKLLTAGVADTPARHGCTVRTVYIYPREITSRRSRTDRDAAVWRACGSDRPTDRPAPARASVGCGWGLGFVSGFPFSRAARPRAGSQKICARAPRSPRGREPRAAPLEMMGGKAPRARVFGAARARHTPAFDAPKRLRGESVC